MMCMFVPGMDQAFQYTQQGGGKQGLEPTCQDRYMTMTSGQFERPDHDLTRNDGQV